MVAVVRGKAVHLVGLTSAGRHLRLAVRAYEPKGVLGALCAVATAEAVRVKTGQPIGRQTVKWLRPWRMDGLLLADAARAGARDTQGHRHRGPRTQLHRELCGVECACGKLECGAGNHRAR